jgi:hypothetical protein
MRIFYDTEFLEDGRTIELISIGMVADDDRELYLVNRDAPWDRIRDQPWLMANVVPHLPGAPTPSDSSAHDSSAGRTTTGGSLVDLGDPIVKSLKVIAERVLAFVEATPQPQLWAWYAAYDHVALCQLFGRMIDLPDAVPTWTNDVQQVVAAAGEPPLTTQSSGTHHALADARHARLILALIEQESA